MNRPFPFQPSPFMPQPLAPQPPQPPRFALTTVAPAGAITPTGAVTPAPNVPTGGVASTIVERVPWWIWATGGLLLAGTGYFLWRTSQNLIRIRTTLEEEVVPIVLESRMPGIGARLGRAAASSKRDATSAATRRRTRRESPSPTKRDPRRPDTRRR